MGLVWMFAGGNRIAAGAAFLPAVAKGAVSGATDGLLRSAGVASAAGEGVKAIGERFVMVVVLTCGQGWWSWALPCAPGRWGIRSGAEGHGPGWYR